MKGVILAGGLATRLRPLTWVTNKHLLPVYNKPMIYYPLEAIAQGERIVVILGDNIFNFDLRSAREKFEKRGEGAMVFGVRMPTESKQYGVIEIDSSGKVISIEEKPEKPKSDIAQTGIYMYDETVFDKIKNLSPSARGEIEVTDLNNIFVKEGTAICELIDWWIDAGTSHDELLRANNLVYEKVKAGEL